MTMKLYKKDFSPFYRGTLSLIEKYNLDIELIDVNLFEGEHMEAEYSAISEYQTIPCLVDGNITINQGLTILKYLATKYNWAEYPQELSKKVVIDETLDFLATDYMNFVNLLTNGMGIIPFLACSESASNEVREKIKDKKDRCLRILETKLSKNKFLCGDEITIADYQGFGLVAFGFINKDFSLDEYPNVKQWLTNYSVAETYKSELQELAKGLEEFNRQAQAVPA